MLELDQVRAGYGASQVLFDLSLRVAEGQVVALMGRNGMGKTTTIRTIMGLLPVRGGTVRFRGQDLAGLPPHAIARLGLGLVPEGREVFPSLTVRENLVATEANRLGAARPWTLDRVVGLFPRLGERLAQRAGTLSGGEQQMLAIGRALMTNPVLLLLDEATEGLAPLIRAEIWQCIAGLKQEGQAVLIVDKNLDALRLLGEWHYMLEKGRIAWSGDSDALVADPALARRYLGV